MLGCAWRSSQQSLGFIWGTGGDPVEHRCLLRLNWNWFQCWRQAAAWWISVNQIVRAALLRSAKIYRTAAMLSMQFTFRRFIVIPSPAQSATHKSLLSLLENQYPFRSCQQSWNEHYAYLCIFPLVNPTTYGDHFPIKSNAGYILGPSHVVSEPDGACLLHPHEQFTHTLTPILINTIEL